MNNANRRDKFRDQIGGAPVGQRLFSPNAERGSGRNGRTSSGSFEKGVSLLSRKSRPCTAADSGHMKLSGGTLFVRLIDEAASAASVVRASVMSLATCWG